MVQDRENRAKENILFRKKLERRTEPGESQRISRHIFEHCVITVERA